MTDTKQITVTLTPQQQYEVGTKGYRNLCLTGEQFDSVRSALKAEWTRERPKVLCGGWTPNAVSTDYWCISGTEIKHVTVPIHCFIFRDTDIFAPTNDLALELSQIAQGTWLPKKDDRYTCYRKNLNEYSDNNNVALWDFRKEDSELYIYAPTYPQLASLVKKWQAEQKPEEPKTVVLGPDTPLGWYRVAKEYYGASCAKCFIDKTVQLIGLDDVAEVGIFDVPMCNKFTYGTTLEPVPAPVAEVGEDETIDFAKIAHQWITGDTESNCIRLESLIRSAYDKGCTQGRSDLQRVVTKAMEEPKP